MNFTETQKIDFLKKAIFTADNSACGYKTGCVGVVKDHGQKISPEALKDQYVRKRNGYIYIKAWNETLPGEIFCQARDDKGDRICIREAEKLKGREIQKVCSSHAEIGVISKCAKYGIPVDGMSMFVSTAPCIICARAIVQSGIKGVYYMSEYIGSEGLIFLERNQIYLERIPQERVLL